MKKLSPEEMNTLQLLLDRAIVNEQLAIGTPSKSDGTTSYATTEIGCACDHVEVMVIDLTPKGVKELWVKYNGAKGGLAKARNAKKRKAR